MNIRHKVLHVAESFGGGVATALAQYASATPELEHHLLRTVRQGDYIDGGELKVFSTVNELPRNPLAARTAIREAVGSLTPSVVHAHSSFGGAYVRTSIRARPEMQIVYTPHGYAFERKDISRFSAFLYQSAERLLSHNTSVFAACSPREAYLSAFKRYQGRIVCVPNVAEPRPVRGKHNSKPRGGLTVVGVGRLAPQRDPQFFAEVVEQVRRTEPNVRFVWVGGGGAAYVDALQNVGVDVTGWLTRDDARALLDDADLHIHTATWDGFPIVLLEANESRVPSLVRNVAPFAAVPGALRSSTPQQMAEQILSLRDSQNRAQVLSLWDEFLKENTPAIQRERLIAVYDLKIQE